jgi:Heparinase II/III-like protein/Heparinase II/III N-terminus
MTGALPVFKRLVWLRRRLKRMAPGELPHRLGEAVRVVCQRGGLGSARRVPPPAADAAFGKPWCRVPHQAELASGAVTQLLDRADLLLHTGPTLFGHAMGGRWLWNADPRTGWQPPARFGLFIDFRHLPQGVDVKFLWELNRHVWWLPLAQAWAWTQQRVYLDRLGALLESWLTECPYPQGPNWSSPVEHGVRLIVWSLVWHLIGGRASPLFDGPQGERLLQRWTDSVYQHIRFASDNYSLHSSANNHLIGEAAGVFVAAHTWDLWVETRVLRAQAKQILERELLLQFQPDGLNAEQAMCYHKFSLQFMLASALCGRAAGDDFAAPGWTRLGDALVAVGSLMDCAGKVPMYGDADDGEVFRFDPSTSFSHYAALVALGAALTGRADMAAKAASVQHLAGMQLAWVVPPACPPWVDSAAGTQLPTRFVDTGVLLLGDALHSAQEFRLQMDVGPLGSNLIAGHGHADALSLQLSCGGEALLVDPGTYCYNTEPAWRHFFRSTRAHNTLEVDGTDQSVYGGSFLWLSDVHCTLDYIKDTEDGVEVLAHHTGYQHLSDPVIHHRLVRLIRAERVVVVEDWITCKRPHLVALHWHLAEHAKLIPQADGTWWVCGTATALRLQWHGDGLSASAVCGSMQPLQGWVSNAFYHRAAAPVLAVAGRLAPGQRVVTRLSSCQPQAVPATSPSAGASVHPLEPCRV